MHELAVDTSAEAGAQLLAAIGALGAGGAAGVLRLQRFVAAGLGQPELVPASSPPTPEALAQLLSADSRRAAVERLALATMIVPPLDADRLARLEAYAVALERAEEPALVDLRRALAGQHRRLTAALMRRFPPTQRIRRAWREGSLAARWRFIKAMMRLPDAHTAARYRGLEQLPEDTLGRRFFAHCRAGGFALPGERGGLPEPMVFHDMIHGLVGASTQVDDEVLLAGFEAARMGEQGFTMLEFALLLFNLGAQLPTDAEPLVGAVKLDVLLDAYEAGRSASLDVLAWDPWADVEVPVGELRARYGIDAALVRG